MFNYPKQTARVLTFSHFNRKGWSLFSSLHREVRIGVLSAATLTTATPCLAGATAAHAEGYPTANLTEMTADTLTLGEAAVVTASRAPMAAGMAARQVVTLTRDDLNAAGVTCINDVLKLTSGIDVRQRGGFGMQTDISIHGGTHDQIAILLNGIPLVNPQTGHNAADFPLNISDIERIEILEGAASRVAGSQAFSGAINVITRGTQTHRDKPMSWQGRVEGGSYATVRGEMRTDWQHKGWFASASGSYQRSDGAVSNSNFKGGKGYGRVAYAAPAFDADLQLGATANDFGANTFYAAAYPNQWEATRRYLIAARVATKGRIALSGQASWLRSTDHFQLTRGSSAGENFHRTDVLGVGVNAHTRWTGGTTTLGVDLREEDIYSTNLGYPLPDNGMVGVPGHAGKLYTHQADRTNFSCFAEHNVVWRQFSLSLGMMAERNSAVDGQFRFYPGADLSYRPNHFWRIYASFNRSMRLPSFTDLWYKSPTQQGNDGLRPEECTAVNVGADFTHRVLSLKLKGHYQRGTNMIDWIMRSPNDIYHAASFSLDNFGLGLDARCHFDAWLGTRQPLQQLTVSYAWLHQNRRKGEAYFKSNYAMEYLRHKLVVQLSHRIVSKLNAQWSLRLQQREGAWQVFEGGKPTAELRPYGTQALLDCKLNWQEKHWAVFADLSNLTNHRYVDLANVKQPGFLLLGGVSFNL